MDSEKIIIDSVIDLSDSVVPESTFGLKLKELNANNTVVTIHQNSQQLAYIESIPNQIKIDGAFGDWLEVPKYQDIDENKIENSNLDIQDFAEIFVLQYFFPTCYYPSFRDVFPRYCPRHYC